MMKIELQELNPRKLSEDEERKIFVKYITEIDLTLMPLLKTLVKDIILMKVDKIKSYEEAIKDLNEHIQKMQNKNDNDKTWHESEISRYKAKISATKDEIKSYEFIVNTLRTKQKINVPYNDKPLSLDLILMIKEDKKQSDTIFDFLQRVIQRVVDQINWDKNILFNIYNEKVTEDIIFKTQFFKLIQSMNDTIVSYHEILSLMQEKHDIYEKLNDFLQFFEKNDQGKKDSFVEKYKLQNRSPLTEYSF